MIGAGWWAWSVGAQTGPPLEYAIEPPDKIVRSESCGECHLAEFEVWKTTRHATGFRSLHRGEAAEAIASKMGLRLMKRDSPCLTCHYTPVVEKGQLRAASGVSCESCHGAGKDWIDLHNDYGKGFDFKTESAEHRRTRIEASVKAGMRRPSNLYDVATSCYTCHTVPDEKLVNVGGHTVGTVGFELVERSQGSIRHNFLASTRGEDNDENRLRSKVNKRPMYVVGRLVALEYSLRGVGEASENGAYSRAMSRRYQTALREVQKISLSSSIPEIEEILGVATQVRAVPNNRQALLAAADQISAIARRFAAGSDGTKLASLDGLVEGTAEPEPELDEVLAEGDLEDDSGLSGSGESQVAEGGAANQGGGATTAGPGGASQAGGTTQVASSGRPAVGKKKRRIRPRSSHRTLGPGACAGCHQDSNEWWARDAHFASAQPFFGREKRNVEIALLYEVQVGNMTKGNQICMDCHGSVVSGSESFEVFDGVGCESCHGPAKDFLEPHKEGDKALGTSRPGYVNALKLGMVELQNLNTRAATCTGCHYINDERLISAGHPSGKGFDYVAAMGKIKHWKHPSASGSALTAAFGRAVASRGPVPTVERAELASAAAATVDQQRKSSPSVQQAGGGSWNRPRPAGGGGGQTALSSLAGPRSGGPPQPVVVRQGSLELPPFPQVDQVVPIEDVLLLIKERLELLHRAVYEPPGGAS